MSDTVALQYEDFFSRYPHMRPDNVDRVLSESEAKTLMRLLDAAETLCIELGMRGYNKAAIEAYKLCETHPIIKKLIKDEKPYAARTKTKAR